MKKTLVVVGILACLVLALTACSGNRDAELLGTWKPISAEVAGQALPADQMGQFQYQFTFEKDYRAKVEIAGQSFDTSYTLEDDIIGFDNAALTQFSLKFDGGLFALEEPTSQTKIIFEKEN